MNELLTLIVMIAALLVLSGFFSGSETALTATSKARMRTLEKDGDNRARRVNRLIEDRERLIGAILLGNNLVNILASALAATAFVGLFGEAGVAWATLVMTALVLIFAEVLPKTLAISNPDNAAMTVAPVIRWVVLILAPIVRLVRAIVRLVLKIFGVDIDAAEPVLTANEEIRGAIELHHEEGAVVKRARDMLGGVLDLAEIRIEEVMIHRKNIEMLDLAEPAETLVAAALESVHTRLPLYRDNAENIIGVLHAKDLLRALWDVGGDANKVDVEKIARPPWFVPETTTIGEQLEAFKQQRNHFALIVDEYGALMGLVTLEDIIEEIVGDIEDEHDLAVKGVRPQPDGTVQVDGVVSIRDLNRALDWQLPDEAAVTVAGLVIHESQTIPDPGQKFVFHGFRFEVLRRQRNQITALKITPIEETAGAA